MVCPLRTLDLNLHARVMMSLAPGKTNNSHECTGQPLTWGNKGIFSIFRLLHASDISSSGTVGPRPSLDYPSLI